jgi:hypothetical protein
LSDCICALPNKYIYLNKEERRRQRLNRDVAFRIAKVSQKGGLVLHLCTVRGGPKLRRKPKAKSDCRQSHGATLREGNGEGAVRWRTSSSASTPNRRSCSVADVAPALHRALSIRFGVLALQQHLDRLVPDHESGLERFRRRNERGDVGIDVDRDILAIGIQRW